MRRSSWSLVLCIGVCWVVTRPLEADRPSADERPPAVLVCTPDAADADADAEAMCGKCGDGYCNPRCGETATSCPKDCGATT